MTFQHFLTAAAILVAIAALVRARRVSKRLERLSESYWELRYEYGQLRARVATLEGDPAPTGSPGGPSRPRDLPGQGSFVPLSSLKR